MEGKKYKKLNESPPSDEFLRAFCHAGSIAIQCTFCGRQFYTTFDGEGSFDEGELEHYKEMEKDNPDSCYDVSTYSSAEWGNLNGEQLVWGCPCNAGTNYEKFIWQHRYQIADYFYARAEKELRSAQIEKDNADKAKDAVRG